MLVKILTFKNAVVVTCWEMANDLLALLCVTFYCALSLSRVVPWLVPCVRCGT